MNRESAGWIVAAVAVGLVLTMGAMHQFGMPRRFQVVECVPYGPRAKGSLSTLLDTDTGQTRYLWWGEDGLMWTPIHVEKK